MLQRNCRIPLLELARRLILHCSLLAGFCLKSIKMMTQEEKKLQCSSMLNSFLSVTTLIAIEGCEISHVTAQC